MRANRLAGLPGDAVSVSAWNTSEADIDRSVAAITACAAPNQATGQPGAAGSPARSHRHSMIMISGATIGTARPPMLR